jgi:uncharacterized protein DUF4190
VILPEPPGPFTHPSYPPDQPPAHQQPLSWPPIAWQPPVGKPPVPADPSPGQPPSAPPTSGYARASLVFGIIGVLGGWGLFGVPCLIAVVTGHAALKDTRTGRRGGHGMAVAGLILGYPFAMLSILGGGSALVGMLFTRSRPSARSSARTRRTTRPRHVQALSGSRQCGIGRDLIRRPRTAQGE